MTSLVSGADVASSSRRNVGLNSASDPDSCSTQPPRASAGKSNASSSSRSKTAYSPPVRILLLTCVEQQQAHLLEVSTNGATGHTEALGDFIAVERSEVPHLDDADEAAIHRRQLVQQIDDADDLIRGALDWRC